MTAVAAAAAPVVVVLVEMAAAAAAHILDPNHFAVAGTAATP